MAKNKKRYYQRSFSEALSIADEASIKEDRPLSIALIVIGIIIVLAAIAWQIAYSIRIGKCTAMTTGIIVNVETREKKDEDSSSYTQYKAYIEFEEGSPLIEYPIESYWTRKIYIEGQKITVYYDPENVSNHYAEGVDKNPAPWIAFFGIVLLITGLSGYKFGLGTD